MSPEWLDALLERAADLAFAQDDSGTITWVSPGAQRALGWKPGDLEGRPVATLLVSPDGSDAGPGAGLVQAVTASGARRWFTARTVDLTDAQGRPSGTASLLADVDDLVRERERAEFEAQRRAAIVEALLDPHVLLDPVRGSDGRVADFVYVDANEIACRDQDVPLEALLGASVALRWPAVREAGILDRLAEVAETGEPLLLDDVALPGPGGAARYYDTRAVRVGRYLSLTWRDVTGRHESEEALARSEEHFRLLAENILDVIVRMRDGVIVWVSGSVQGVLGWTPDLLVGRAIEDLVHAEDRELFGQTRASLMAGEPVTGRFRLQAAGGGHHWVESHAKPYWLPDGGTDGSVTTLHVVDAEVAALAELDRRARFDDLTGVLKRDEAIRRLESLDQYQRQPGDECGVLFLDLDEFKEVNDAWGHAAGDTVLRTVTTRVRAILRAGDTVARMGGDEFLVILEGLHSVDEAVVIAEKIRAATAEPIPIPGAIVHVTATVGATLRVRGEGADSVIARADAAMYRGKDNGRDHVVVIPPAVTDGG